MVARLRRVLPLLFVVTVLSACASTGRADRDNSDLLTREQIQQTGAVNLFQVISRLRPRWLNVRSSRSFGMETEIVVFQNDMLLGGPDALKQMSLDLAWEIEYLDGPTATASLPGLMSGRHIEGAIVVRTRSSGGG